MKHCIWGAFHYAKNFGNFGWEFNGKLWFEGNFPTNVVHLQRCSFLPLLSGRPTETCPFHFKKFSSKFGSRRNRKLRSGWKLCFNRTMSFHFLLVSGQPGRSRARVRRERRSPRNEDSRLWGKRTTARGLGSGWPVGSAKYSKWKAPLVCDALVVPLTSSQVSEMKPPPPKTLLIVKGRT